MKINRNGKIKIRNDKAEEFVYKRGFDKGDIKRGSMKERQ